MNARHWQSYAVRPNHSERIPFRHVLFDCESVPIANNPVARIETQRLRLWCAQSLTMKKGEVSGKTHAKGKTQADWWAWLWRQTSTHFPVWVWAHNAKVDLTWAGLWQQLDGHDWEYKDGVFDSPPFIVWTKWKGRSVIFLDTLNWWRVSLAELGKDLGCMKWDMPGFTCPDSDWFDYCANDVEVIAQALMGLVGYIRENAHGMMRFTVAGQAWSSWRHTHQGPWPRYHGVASVSMMERQSYRGGRCEVYFRGRVSGSNPTFKEEQYLQKTEGPVIFRDQVTIYDVRSFYPSIMYGRLYPWNLERELDNVTVGELERLAYRRALIATVILDTPNEPFPVEHGGERIYATGCFVTTLCGPEIKRALQMGVVKAVGKVLDYDQADLFSPWVEAHWKRREHFRSLGLRSWELLEKTLGNSLYGYFGRRDHNWQLVTKWPKRKRWGDWLELLPLETAWKFLPKKLATRMLLQHGRNAEILFRLRGIAGRVYLQTERGEWHQAVVSIPATVTSWARVMMREWQEVLPRHTACYSHTDSLHVLNAGKAALEAAGLVGDGEPGKLRLQDGPADAHYLARQVYKFGDKWVMAGLSRKGRFTADGEYEYPCWDDFASIINRPLDGTINIHQLSAKLAEWSPPGIVGKDGWVLPLSIDGNKCATSSVPF